MVHELEPYAVMRDSGVRWFGEVPTHWRVLRMRNVAEMRVSNVDKHIVEGEVPVRLCNYVDVYKNNRITNRIQFMRATATPEEIERFRLQQGDVIITKDSEEWNDIGVPALVEYNSPDLVCGYHLAILRPNEKVVNCAYLFRALQSKSVAYQFHVSANGVTRYGLSHDVIKSAFIPVPPYVEQLGIARFLDYVDGRIRVYIQAKRRLIELLGEQKQVIIHKAVTQGISSNPSLKPSGNKLLGNVPEHWQIKPLKRLAKINRSVLPQGTDPDYQFQYLDIGAVGTGFLNEQPEPLRFGVAPSRARRILRKGDTIVSTVRTYLKAIYYVANDVTNLIASTGFAVLTPNSDVEPEFLSLLIQNNSFIERVMAYSVGTTYPAIAETRLSAFKVALPATPEEQKAIVSYVKSETTGIDQVILAAQHEVELFREYRTRIIEDAVMGKADLRGIELPESVETEDVMPFPRNMTETYDDDDLTIEEDR